jgi:hypothetical protein
MDPKSGVTGLLSSRKALAVSISSMAAVVIQGLGFLAQVKGWSPDELARWVFVTNVSSLVVFLAGMFVAWLWQRESWARDFGVTEVTPAELELKGKVVEGLLARLPPDIVRQLLAMGQSPLTLPPAAPKPVVD